MYIYNLRVPNLNFVALVKPYPSLKVEQGNQVEILNDVVCISLRDKPLGKAWTHLFPPQKKRGNIKKDFVKLWIQTSCNALKN